MVMRDNNNIFEFLQVPDIPRGELFVRSTVDGLYIFPWQILHSGNQVTRQDTVVRTSPDAGPPITHSRFSAGGRIIAARSYVDLEQQFWIWLRQATQDTLLPFWVYDRRISAFMRCTFMEQPTLQPADNSVKAVFVDLKFFAKAASIPMTRFITENTPERVVTEGDGALIYEDNEVIY